LEDNQCASGKSCAVDVCVSGHCSYYIQEQEECCGDFVCGAGEASGCSDCELTTISNPSCSGDECSTPKGMMFDVTSSQDIVINSLAIQLYNGTNNIAVYTTDGSYSAVPTDPSQWTRIYTNSFVELGEIL
jgi:hypothetical protein